MAHFGLGYTLYELGRFPEAYRHLRHYTEIAPCGGWNWCWLGRAAEAIGETGEARNAYERALALEDAGHEETDAAELLDALSRRS
jgi:Flp pilus assembly protein TadD